MQPRCGREQALRRHASGATILGFNLSWLDLNYLGSQPWDLTQAELHVTVFDYSERGVRVRYRYEEDGRTVAIGHR